MCPIEAQIEDFHIVVEPSEDIPIPIEVSPEVRILTALNVGPQGPPGPQGEMGPMDPGLADHIIDEDPHPIYDDGTSFILRYENAKV